jgi:large subunit ribosomal protein L18
MDKKASRIRRAKKTRARIRDNQKVRLCVNRTPRHIYAQVISADGGRVIATASTVEKVLRDELAFTGNTAAAARVGALVAERAREQGVEEVAFDRAGFQYHGRIKALADAAREAGLQF